MDNAIYIVFSATPTTMGAGIRVVTRNPYNHVSLSLERDIRKMYSFARYYWAAPLYGGLVAESILRYSSFSGHSQVKICRVPVEERRMIELQNYLHILWEERESYIYNNLDALASLVRRRHYVPRAYTCATFVEEILTRFRLVDRDLLNATIRGLEEALEDYVIYEGAVPKVHQADWGEDSFPQDTTVGSAVYLTARHFGRLAKRAVRGCV